MQGNILSSDISIGFILLIGFSDATNNNSVIFRVFNQPKGYYPVNFLMAE